MRRRDKNFHILSVGR